MKSGRGDLVAKLPWFLNGTTSLGMYLNQEWDSRDFYKLDYVWDWYDNIWLRFTFLVRIITVTMETADPNILIGSVLSMTLNYVIIGVIIAYTPKEIPVEDDGNMEPSEAKKIK